VGEKVLRQSADEALLLDEALAALAGELGELAEFAELADAGLAGLAAVAGLAGLAGLFALAGEVAVVAEAGLAGLFADTGLFAEAPDEAPFCGAGWEESDGESTTPAGWAPLSMGAATAVPAPRPSAVIAPTASHVFFWSFIVSSWERGRRCGSGVVLTSQRFAERRESIRRGG
jgi:hypothetical protein